MHNIHIVMQEKLSKELTAKLMLKEIPSINERLTLSKYQYRILKYNNVKFNII